MVLHLQRVQSMPSKGSVTDSQQSASLYPSSNWQGPAARGSRAVAEAIEMIDVRISVSGIVVIVVVNMITIK